MIFRMFVIFIIAIIIMDDIIIYYFFLNQDPFSIQVRSMELILRPSFVLPLQFKVVYLIDLLCVDYDKVAFPTQPENFYFIKPYVHIIIIIILLFMRSRVIRRGARCWQDATSFH